MDHSELDPEQIVHKGLNIAAEICIYTNANRTVEVLDAE
jgi:ATP-dependent HslUV protease subunit HslV